MSYSIQKRPLVKPAIVAWEADKIASGTKAVGERIYPKEKKKLVLDVLYKHFGKCQWCGCNLDPPHKKTFKAATIDHIVELRKMQMGRHSISNLKISCLRCNNGRDIFDGCIGAFMCYSHIYGEKATIQNIQDKLQISGKSKKRINFNIEDKNFKHSSNYFANFSKHLRLQYKDVPYARIKQKPDARILYVHKQTQKYKYLVLHWKSRGVTFDGIYNLKLNRLLILNNQAFEIEIPEHRYDMEC